MSTGSLKSTENQVQYHQFRVRCLSNKEILTGKKYHLVREMKQDASNLYEKVDFNDNNTILTYLNNNHKHVLLTTVPDLMKKGQYQDLFIEFVSTFFRHLHRFDVDVWNLDSSGLRHVFEFLWYS